MTTKNIYTDWISRLFHFLRNSPNVTGEIEILSTLMQESVDAAAFILTSMSIDTAEGDQLDTIASWLGLQRPPAQEERIFILEADGETYDIDNDHGFEDDTDPSVTTGGYLIGEDGLAAVDGSNMSDVDFRYLIRQKATSYRRFMTRENLFSYLLTFGSRCLIDDDTDKEVEIDPINYYDLNTWEKYYVITRGFKPAGIKIFFRENMRDGDSI